MKTSKFVIALMLVGAMLSNGCKKEAGPAGPKGDTGATGPQGPDATTQTYTLNFTTSVNFQLYAGFASIFDAEDMIITYVYNGNYSGTDYYVQLPYVVSGLANIYAEVGETNGLIFVNTDKADGTTGSPWTGPVTLKFKSILIKSRAVKAHPDLDYKDYNAVKAAFNLKD